MTYGFIVKNLDGDVVLDHSSSPLAVARERSVPTSFITMSNPNYNHYQANLSDRVPGSLIFVQMPVGRLIYGLTSSVGIREASHPGHILVRECVPAYADTLNDGDYGMEVYDESGGVLYRSSSNILEFSRHHFLRRVTTTSEYNEYPIAPIPVQSDENWVCIMSSYWSILSNPHGDFVRGPMGIKRTSNTEYIFDEFKMQYFSMGPAGPVGYHRGDTNVFFAR